MSSSHSRRQGQNPNSFSSNGSNLENHYTGPQIGASRASVTSNTSSQASSRVAPPSVNDLIERSRVQSRHRPSVTATHRVQDVVNRPSLPPEMTDILSIPQTGPIISRRNFNRNRSRLPLDAWNHVYRANATNPNAIHSVSRREPRQRPSTFSQLLRDSFQLPDSKSLRHIAFRSMAENWNLIKFDQEGLNYFVESARCIILGYVSLYGPEQGITKEDIHCLFPHDEDVKVIELNGLLSNGFDLVDLYRHLSRISKKPLQVPDTWEEQLEAEMNPNLTKPSTHLFEHLTHLGLGNPSHHASWAQLIAVAPFMRTLTHLSLAYWPTPSLTPDFIPATSQRYILPEYSKFSDLPFLELSNSVRVAVTHHFTMRIEEFKDAAYILRMLSQHLYQLKYLDLEGCHSWLPALSWQEGGHEIQSRGINTESENAEDWLLHHPRTPPLTREFPAILTGNWSSVIEINVSQGWIPTSPKNLSKMPDSDILNRTISRIQHQFPDLSWPSRATPSVRMNRDQIITESEFDVLKWIETETQIRLCCHRISMIRAHEKGERILFPSSLIVDLTKAYQDQEYQQLNLKEITMSRKELKKSWAHDDPRTRRV